MYQLKINNIALSIISAITGIAAGIGVCFVPIQPVNLSIIIMLITALVLILIISLLVYTKATTTQVLKMSLINILVFAAILFTAGFVSQLLGVGKFSINSSGNLLINPALLVVSLITGFISVNFLFKFEAIKPVEKKSDQSVIVQNEVNASPETIQEPSKIIKAQISAPEMVKLPETTQIAYTQPKTNEVKNEESVENLGSLPQIDLNKVEKINLQETLEKREDINTERIPETVRLNSNAKTENVNTKGKISSIGKLLINQRDLENIIETNALMQNMASDTSGQLNIISTVHGGKTKDMIEKVKQTYQQISDISIFDKAGFTFSSTYSDVFREQTVGAMYSGAYNVIQNYLNQLNIQSPSKIYFKTDKDSVMLSAIGSELVHLSFAGNFDAANYGQLSDILKKTSLSQDDLMTIKNTGISNVLVLDSEGRLLTSSNPESGSQQAPIFSAIFENIKIFIAGIQESNLNKMVIFNNNSIIIIKKFSDKTGIFISNQSGQIALIPEIVQIHNDIKWETK